MKRFFVISAYAFLSLMTTMPAWGQGVSAIDRLTGNPHKMNWIKKEKGKLLFHTSQTSDGKPMMFRPLYEIHDSRFADYLNTN